MARALSRAELRAKKIREDAARDQRRIERIAKAAAKPPSKRSRTEKAGLTRDRKAMVERKKRLRRQGNADVARELTTREREAIAEAREAQKVKVTFSQVRLTADSGGKAIPRKVSEIVQEIELADVLAAGERPTRQEIIDSAFDLWQEGATVPLTFVGAERIELDYL